VTPSTNRGKSVCEGANRLAPTDVIVVSTGHEAG